MCAGGKNVAGNAEQAYFCVECERQLDSSAAFVNHFKQKKEPNSSAPSV
jgi:hypothetical protein